MTPFYILRGRSLSEDHVEGRLHSHRHPKGRPPGLLRLPQRHVPQHRQARRGGRPLQARVSQRRPHPALFHVHVHWPAGHQQRRGLPQHLRGPLRGHAVPARDPRKAWRRNSRRQHPLLDEEVVRQRLQALHEPGGGEPQAASAGGRRGHKRPSLPPRTFSSSSTTGTPTVSTCHPRSTGGSSTTETHSTPTTTV